MKLVKKIILWILIGHIGSFMTVTLELICNGHASVNAYLIGLLLVPLMLIAYGFAKLIEWCVT